MLARTRAIPPVGKPRTSRDTAQFRAATLGFSLEMPAKLVSTWQVC